VIDNFSFEDEQGGSIFESFSDVALCTLAVTLLFVALLAINITKTLNVEVNRNVFSGGVMRPALYLECTTPDFSATSVNLFAAERALFADTPYVAVHLFSPSLARITTDVNADGTVARGENQTFARQLDLPLYQFMQLVPGIDPGSFKVEGHSTALLLPSILDKQIVYEPGKKDGYRATSDRRLTMKMLSQLWPIYSQPTYPARRSTDYKDARTKILVETQTVAGPQGEEHYVVIGHSVYPVPQAFNDGSLAWLGGFSSGLTEIVFLGETWSDTAKRTNKRIEFFEKSSAKRGVIPRNEPINGLSFLRNRASMLVRKRIGIMRFPLSLLPRRRQ